MAQTQGGFDIKPTSQQLIVNYVKAILSNRKKSMATELHNKMEAIDIAYARYKAGGDMTQGLDATGRDTGSGNECCGDAFSHDDIVAPIVVSQVDTLVAYLSDVFLSGYPLFPVVSSPTKRKWAQQLETLLDDHAQLGGYVRQLLLMLKAGVKYNACALEVEWSSVEQFSVLSDFTNTETGTKTAKNPKFYNKIKCLDMYNTIWDMSVPLAEVAQEGDFCGYIEIISKTKLKRLLNKLHKEKKGMNANQAMASFKKFEAEGAATHSGNYKMHPTISQYITPKQVGYMDWDVWLGVPNAEIGDKKKINLNDGSSYEKVVIYGRILPSDFGIIAPSGNTPQIWKFIVINETVVISAERIISAYDYFPILFGQPMEDGMGNQTQSVAEGAIPFQEAATTLFNIRFAAARRAVSDRALYNADLISPSDVNSTTPAPKIPVRFKVLSNQGFDQAYKQIPFDMRGTETTISDAQQIVAFSQQLNGSNNSQQGQFQKGNKSVQEWTDTMANSDNRFRMPAMMLEAQLFSPMKQLFVLNIFQYGEDSQVVSQRTGNVIDIKIAELRQQVLSFKLADGYTPKSKLVSSEALMAGMNMIMNSPLLQQQYGSSLPNIFAHLMELAGVKDLEQYNPAYQQEAVGGNLATNTLNAPTGLEGQVDPATGLPAPAMGTNLQA